MQRAGKNPDHWRRLCTNSIRFCSYSTLYLLFFSLELKSAVSGKEAKLLSSLSRTVADFSFKLNLATAGTLPGVATLQTTQQEYTLQQQCMSFFSLESVGFGISLPLLTQHLTDANDELMLMRWNATKVQILSRTRCGGGGGGERGRGLCSFYVLLAGLKSKLGYQSVLGLVDFSSLSISGPLCYVLLQRHLASRGQM